MGTYIFCILNTIRALSFRYAAVDASVDGIGGVFIGPGDLSVSLGTFGNDETELFDDAIDRGIDFLAAGSDIAYLNSASTQFKAAFKDVVDQN